MFVLTQKKITSVFDVAVFNKIGYTTKATSQDHFLCVIKKERLVMRKYSLINTILDG
jgi:hypothetical protein